MISLRTGTLDMPGLPTHPAEMSMDAQVLMFLSMWGAFLFMLWCFLRVFRSGSRFR